ncbi:putative inactive receptor kinase [Hibiscus syriacus]|uniref:Inactive receptor kinase n=1 Tax=Hibiscus syriacus TaxID=106335 RepID=A0A6A3AUF9_HIBSY|nr:probable inactive receptor kinase At5g67200 [Hibiscus syriacus]KAE8707047.1 putative inactive receptor kinase [Hibiscus syriacus]
MPNTKFKSLLHLFIFFWVFSTCFSRPITYPPQTNLLFPSDAVSILSFKSKADLDNKLLYALNERFDYCQWRGVKCSQGRVVRYTLQNSGLRGVFPANSLSRLDQLRVLSLHNNSLSGPIPDLSSLYNLKSLFLDRNNFSGTFPPSILFLHRITTLDLSHNGLTGPIPANLTALERVNILRLEWNQFNGSLPPLNQSFLLIFNVSGNNLTGKIPVTPTLSKFNTTAFSLNPGLCGEIIHKACTSRAPFFGSPSASGTLGQSTEAQSGGAVVLQPPSSPKKHRRTGMLLGFTIGIALILFSALLALAVVRKQSGKQRVDSQKTKATTAASLEVTNSNPGNPRTRLQEASERKIVIPEIQKLKRSGNLVFVGGEVEGYSLEQLMRASAELLGRGTMGTTYKAVVDRQLILTVKRLDAGKTAVTAGEDFEQHMDAVGGLIHPNLVPLRAYFQAKGERLVIYDFQPNGSVFNLVHGSRSTRAKPLHWTSCLKIAEDVAQGLAYIHQASRLVHGNLKSTNVLLGTDFEACLTDYCLAVLADSPSTEDPDYAAYKAPEVRKSNRRLTPKSDVYAFGVLLLELLTGKHPSQHPVLVPHDILEWVRTTREDDVRENQRLGMLTEVASVCSLTSPEQRPAMWQVLKMIREIKERAMM